MDNLKDIEEMNDMKSEINKNKVKTMIVKVDEDYIENNLIDLPFIFYYKTSEPITAITYKWVGSDGRQRAVEVRSSKLGIPDPFCYDVLLALFRLYIKQNNNTIVSIKDEHDFNEIDNTVYFTYRELVRELGYKSFSKANKERVKKAIETLVDTNIYNTAFGGFYNPINKKYIMDAEFQVNILYKFANYSYIEKVDEEGNVLLDENGIPLKTIDKSKLKDKCSIKIDRFFIQNLYFGNAKISDKTLRLSLKNDIAKKVYLILNKWRNNRKSMYLKYETLYARIPLTPLKNEYYKKRRVLDALNELKDAGYIYDYEKIKEGVLIYFTEDGLNKKNVDESLLARYNSYEEIIDKLSSHGITDETLKRHFKLHKIPYYQALLRYVDENEKRIDNVTAYVFKGLVIDYEGIDEKYFNK